jgi:hypothetical protein
MSGFIIYTLNIIRMIKARWAVEAYSTHGFRCEMYAKRSLLKPK